MAKARSGNGKTAKGKESRGKQIARRLVAQLRRDLKGIGYGAKKRALDAAGLSRAYHENVKPERIPLGNYFDMLEGVGLDPSRHVDRALKDDDPIADFLADARNIARTSGVPRIIKVAKKRGAPGMPEDDGGVDLDAIDRLIFVNPGCVQAAAESAISRATGASTQKRLLGIWSASQRANGNGDAAWVSVATAMSLAHRGRRDSARLLGWAAKLLQRKQETKWALNLSLAGVAEAVIQGRLNDAALLLVMAATSHSADKQFEDCARLAKSGLLLSADRRVSEVGLHLGARSSFLLGDHHAASVLIKRIERKPAISRDMQGFRCTLKGDFLRARGDYMAAFVQYQRAMGFFEPWVARSVQAGVHAMASLLEAGASERAARLGCDMVHLAGSLAGDDEIIQRGLYRLAMKSRARTLGLEDTAEVMRAYTSGDRTPQS